MQSTYESNDTSAKLQLESGNKLAVIRATKSSLVVENVMKGNIVCSNLP